MIDNSLYGRDYLRMLDLTVQELQLVIDTAAAFKSHWADDPISAQQQAPFTGQAVAIIMEKPSLRTRVSFERAVERLGAQAIVMSDTTSAFSRGESLQDTMLVLERYVDALVIRSFDQSRIQEMADWATIPVVNALTDAFHPCQGLADFMTIQECFGQLKGLKLAYLGDGANNMAHTYLEGAALFGMQAVISAPAGYQPDPQYLSDAQSCATQTGAELVVCESPEEALSGANVVITDSWASMGFEAEHEKRVEVFKPYQVSLESFKLAAEGAIFMHCLPAHRGEEVLDEVMDAGFSRIYDEAENRMHAQQALLYLLMSKEIPA